MFNIGVPVICKKSKQKNKPFGMTTQFLVTHQNNAVIPDYWQQQNKVIGSAQGRGTTWFVALGKMDAALRHYRRGGLFGKIIKDHYIFYWLGKES